ncbi:MAG: hypothetical protein RBJ76_09460 [Stenomitos frigidus ULC029]
MLAWYAVAVLGLSGQVRFFCQDETRLGLKTISGRKITVKGIKPKGKVQWQFKVPICMGWWNRARASTSSMSSLISTAIASKCS